VLLAYIHLNPVSAGLVDDPAEYRWSGHSELLGLRPPSELVDVDDTLMSFGTARGEARRQYVDYVRHCAEARWTREGVRALPWWSTVKDDEELVAPRFGDDYWDYRGARIEIERPEVSIDELAEFTCRHLGFEASRLLSRCKRGAVTDIRVLLSSLAVERYGHRVTAVAEYLRKSRYSVSRWLVQAQKKEQREKAQEGGQPRNITCSAGL
jgi:hypothetical protein